MCVCVVFAGPISSSALQLEQTLLVSCVLLADFRECVCVGSGGVGPTVDGLFSNGNVECQDEENFADASLVEEAIHGRHHRIGSFVQSCLFRQRPHRMG